MVMRFSLFTAPYKTNYDKEMIYVDIETNASTMYTKILTIIISSSSGFFMSQCSDNFWIIF